jgi:protease II
VIDPQSHDGGDRFKRQTVHRCDRDTDRKRLWRSAGHFCAGRQCGGLVMGAIANLRPDLYSGIVAEVPFVDVVTTMSDASVPLTTLEYDEWGNPAVKREYDYMLSYSPYDKRAIRRCL